MYKRTLVSLLAAFLVASFSTFTGCFDYKDDVLPPTADDDDVADDDDDVSDDDTADDDTADDDVGDDDTSDLPDPVDEDGDGHSPDHPTNPDCDDTDPDVHPGALELCDGMDTDCDGHLGWWYLAVDVDTSNCSPEQGDVYWTEGHIVAVGGGGSYEYPYTEGLSADACLTQVDAEDCVDVVIEGDYTPTSFDNWTDNGDGSNGFTVHLEAQDEAKFQS